jgi:hypothetical protein
MGNLPYYLRTPGSESKTTDTPGVSYRLFLADREGVPVVNLMVTLSAPALDVLKVPDVWSHVPEGYIVPTSHESEQRLYYRFGGPLAEDARKATQVLANLKSSIMRALSEKALEAQLARKAHWEQVEDLTRAAPDLLPRFTIGTLAGVHKWKLAQAREKSRAEILSHSILSPAEQYALYEQTLPLVRDGSIPVPIQLEPGQYYCGAFMDEVLSRFHNGKQEGQLKALTLAQSVELLGYYAHCATRGQKGWAPPGPIHALAGDSVERAQRFLTVWESKHSSCGKIDGVPDLVCGVIRHVT